MWRMTTTARDPPVLPVIVTVSYNEGARGCSTAASRSTRCRCPPESCAWMEPFVAEHYKPEPKKKVRRNDPFADGAFRRERGSRG